MPSSRCQPIEASRSSWSHTVETKQSIHLMVSLTWPSKTSWSHSLSHLAEAPWQAYNVCTTFVRCGVNFTHCKANERSLSMIRNFCELFKSISIDRCCLIIKSQWTSGSSLNSFLNFVHSKLLTAKALQRVACAKFGHLALAILKTRCQSISWYGTCNLSCSLASAVAHSVNS